MNNKYWIEEMKRLGEKKRRRTVEAKKYYVYCPEADAWLGRDSSTRDYFLTDEPFQTFRWAQLAPNLKVELVEAYECRGYKHEEYVSYFHFLAQFDWVFVEV